MDLTKLKKDELLMKCQQFGITKCKSKTKAVLISLINAHMQQNIVVPQNNNGSMNVIDLFCGCGGMSKGLTDAGFNIIAGIDIWDKAIQSYTKNFIIMEFVKICITSKM